MSAAYTVVRITFYEEHSTTVSSYFQVMKQPPYELRRRLYIMYKGEDGLDYGGIARFGIVHSLFFDALLMNFPGIHVLQPK